MSKWYYLIKTITVLICLAGIVLGNAQKEAKGLTLKEAVLAGMQQGLEADILQAQGDKLALQRLSMEESGIKHILTGRTGYAKNEIGDSQDLSASAIETTLYTLSYQQLYENGFSWTASQTTRSAEALTETESDEEYSKQLLTLMVPLYGKTTDNTTLFNKKQHLILEEDQRNLQHEINTSQIASARIFVSAYLQAESYKISSRKLVLLENKIDVLSKVPQQGASLDMQLNQFELQREKINNEEQKTIRDQTFHQLELLSGKQPSNSMQLPAELPSLIGPEEQLQDLFLGNSSKLAQLKNQVIMLQQDEAISESQTAPDIYAAGFVGNTSVDDTKGSNYGMYLTVAYHFGGGEEEQVSAVRKEIATLNLRIEKEKNNAMIQYRLNMSKLKSLSKKVFLEEKEQQLLKAQIQLVQQRFQLGEINWEVLTDQEISLQNKRLSRIKSKADSWFQFLTLLEQTNQPLIEIL